MMIHLIINSKISEEFIKYLKKNFDISKHDIVIWNKGNLETDYLEKSLNLEGINFINSKKQLLIFYLKLFKLRKYEKIFIHGWYFPYLSVALFFNSYLLKKIYWRIWGGDNRVFLNETYSKKISLKNYIKIFCDRFCKKRVRGYITHLKEEYDLINEKYNVKGEYIDTFMYPGDIYKERKVFSKEKIDKYYIQIGNSAEGRNHLEVLGKLVFYKEKIEGIYCPLSYGDSDNYREKLLNNIPTLLQDKFYPILKMLPFDEYMEFLSNIDIGIFSFKRQQAFGNILALISMKKTIYLDENSLTYKYFNRIGVKIKSYNIFDELEVFDNEILENNKNIIKKMFSEEKLLEDLEKIFFQKRLIQKA